MVLPVHILLYEDRLPPTVSAPEVAERLGRYFPYTQITRRGEFILHHLAALSETENPILLTQRQGQGKSCWEGRTLRVLRVLRGEQHGFHDTKGTKESQREKVVEELARELAGIRVRDPEREASFSEPAYGEIQYEKRRITNTSIQARGVLYDGFELARILGRLIPKEERTPHHVHIVLTNQLFGTWGDDLRYHYRVSVYSIPSLVSTTGIVEAPAKPREFYLEKQRLAAMGLKDGSVEALKQKYAGQFVDYDDDRMTEIVVGYALQAVVYAATGDPFCSDPNCRFYDGHHQTDLIRAQLQGDKFCQKHAALLEKLGARPGYQE